MSIDDSKGVWFCHSSECGGGSIIDLWMRMNDSRDFGEAITKLGRELNIQLPEYGGGSGISQRRILSALKKVQREAQDFLLNDEHPDAQATRAYLKERGVKKSLIKKWGIGSLPSGREAAKIIQEVCDDELALVEAGILHRNGRDGSLWAAMNGRLHFPIRDESGSVVAFGARMVPEVSHSMEGKFINTHETSVYHKSRILYGEHLLGRDTEHIIVAEGYLDTIALNEMYQDTSTVAVATCGTSLASGHIESINRFQSVTYMFDGDEAGQKASVGALKSLNTLRDKASVCTLTDGDDPWDLFVRGDTKLLEDALDSSASLCDQVVHSKWKLVDGNENKLLDWLRDTVGTLSYHHHRDQIVNIAAEITNKSVSALKRDLAVPVDINSRRVRDGNINSMSDAARGLCMALLDMDDQVRDGIFVGLRPWNRNSEETAQKWLSLTSDMDLMVFKKIVLGAEDSSSEPSVDAAVAEMLSIIEQGGNVGDISFNLRGMAKQELAELSSMKLNGKIEAMQVKMIRQAVKDCKNRDTHGVTFAFLMDTAMNIDDRIQELASKVA